MRSIAFENLNYNCRGKIFAVKIGLPDDEAQLERLLKEQSYLVRLWYKDYQISWEIPTAFLLPGNESDFDFAMTKYCRQMVYDRDKIKI